MTKVLKFECPSCGNTIGVTQRELGVKGPTRCLCGRKKDFNLIGMTIMEA